MEPKKRRKTKGTAIIGRGAATVRIYPIIRKNGSPQNTVCWKEGGRRRMRCFACMDEPKMVAQQISVRLTNGWSLGDEVTRRDIDILRHCEEVVRKYGVELVAAVEEWASARKTAGPIPLADAVRFYAANRTDIFPSRTVAQVADEFVESLRCKGVSDAYVRNAKLHLKGFTAKVSGEIADVTVANEFGYPLRNKIRRHVQREAAKQAWMKRKRRKDRNPSAASDDQSKTNTQTRLDKRPSMNAGGVNDSSDFR